MVATKNTPDSQFEFDISNLFGIWDLGFLATEMSGLDETPWDVCDFNFLCSSALALIQWQCGLAIRGHFSAPQATQKVLSEGLAPN